jgi:hypothetical protein
MTEKSNNFQGRWVEKSVAVGSFLVAVVFAFVSLALADFHEVAAGNCSVIAQFLLLTASLFGIDYKLNAHGSTTRAPQQQPTEHSQG